MFREPRPWQADMLTDYKADNEKSVYTLAACPAAGKTFVMIECAKYHLANDSRVKRVIVVVPTTHLKRQFVRAARESGLKLMELDNGRHIGQLPADEFGGVVTYQQVASNPLIYARYARETFVIFDEAHHMADEQSWGERMNEAFGHCPRKFLTTGTPFRHDNNAIPFVTYDESDELVVDYSYSLGDAWRDSPKSGVRPISFHSVDATAEWTTSDGVEMKVKASEVERDFTGAALECLHGVRGEWWPKTFEMADSQLDSLRLSVPNAAGLIICRDIRHASEYEHWIKENTGQSPVVVHSELKDPNAVIAEFRKGNGKWLIAVDMVSEGVDIPRLRGLIHAHSSRTATHFQQSTGRVLRMDGADDTTWGFLYYPPIAAFRMHVEQMEEMQAHALKTRPEREEMGDGEAFTEGGIVIGLSTDAVPYEIYTPGFGSIDGELAAMLEASLPPHLAHLAPEIAAGWSDVPGIKEVLSTVPSATATATLDQPFTEFDREAAEKENQRLANQCDYFGSLRPGTTNTEMVRRFDCGRPLRTEPQLVEERELLDARVRKLKLAARRAA
jgi:superfamily II DNA or RNA helicase